MTFLKLVLFFYLLSHTHSLSPVLSKPLLQVRLEDSRVEIKYGGAWGSVCAKDWGAKEAMVVCRQLGFQGYRSVGFKPGTDSQWIWIGGVKCTGHEARIEDCSWEELGLVNCDPRILATVSCDGNSLTLIHTNTYTHTLSLFLHLSIYSLLNQQLKALLDFKVEPRRRKVVWRCSLMVNGAVCVVGIGALGVELSHVRSWAMPVLQKSPEQLSTVTLALRPLLSGWRVLIVLRMTAEFVTALMNRLDTSHVSMTMI